jgi:hypothetical protein
MTVDSILAQKLENHIGAYNMVLQLNNNWYEIPFTFLWDECVIRRDTNPKKYANDLERFMVIDIIVNELLSRWDYFESAMQRMRVESSKIKKYQ